MISVYLLKRWYTHSMLIPGVGKDKDTDLGLCQDGSGSNKKGEAEQYCSFWLEDWTAEQPPINLNRRW